MKLIGTIVFILLNISITTAQKLPKSKTGKELFESKCTLCHGKDGTRGVFGAKNLQISRLNDTALVETISKGRNIMPSWERKLTTDQIKLVIEYIKTLRK